MNENYRRVAVTGIGAITPVGNNVNDTWEGLKNGKNGIAPITGFNTEIVQTLPATGISGTFYFVTGDNNNENDIYEEYLWINNGWEDEMKENYFSWRLEDILKLTGYNYSPIFECRYQLPYLGEKWRKEYNGWYNPDIHTPAQFILRRDD